MDAFDALVADLEKIKQKEPNNVTQETQIGEELELVCI
jgi:hypothetical protein